MTTCIRATPHPSLLTKCYLNNGYLSSDKFQVMPYQYLIAIVLCCLLEGLSLPCQSQVDDFIEGHGAFERLAKYEWSNHTQTLDTAIASTFQYDNKAFSIAFGDTLICFQIINYEAKPSELGGISMTLFGNNETASIFLNSNKPKLSHCSYKRLDAFGKCIDEHYFYLIPTGGDL